MRSRYATLLSLPFVLLLLAAQIAVGMIVLPPQMMELAQVIRTAPTGHAGAPPAADHRSIADMSLPGMCSSEREGVK